MKITSKINTVFDKGTDILAILAIAMVVFVTLLINADVIGRYFLNTPIRNVSEATEHSLLWITFFGAAWALKKGAHVRVDVVYNLLSPRVQALSDLITSILGIVVCLALTWAGGQATWNAWQRGTPFTTMWALPQAPILAVVPIGSFLILIEFLRQSRANVSRWRLQRSNRDKVTITTPN